MTKAVTLESKMELFADSLTESKSFGFGDIRYGIPDSKVMIKLGCTPQSWTRVRPLLNQHLKQNNLIVTEFRNDVKVEILNITMRYDKKNKLWYGKNNPLNIYEKNEFGMIRRQMTPEELEKYRICWYVMNDFEY
jgi:hypothetical protein